jgi:hypothetical protein
MRVPLGVMAACAALGSAAGAQPAPAYPQHDIRCFIVASTVVGGADNEKAKSAGMLAAIYFAGKIYGASPQIGLQAAIETELDKMADIDLTTVRKECGEEMRVHGNEIEGAGKALQAKGK